MWFLPLIQSAVGLGQSIYSGIKAGEDRKQADALQAKQEADNESWYNKEYYTDYTKRADSQNLLKRLKETTDTNNKRNEMTAAITGATDESVQASKDANNKVVSDTMGNLAAMGAKYKDNVMSTYMGRKDNLMKNKYDTLLQRAQSDETGMYNGIGQIGSGIMGAAGNLQNQLPNYNPATPLKAPGNIGVTGGVMPISYPLPDAMTNKNYKFGQ